MNEAQEKIDKVKTILLSIQKGIEDCKTLLEGVKENAE